MPPEKTRVGVVHSTHKGLAKPVSPEHPLDYELVRDMVWKAIGYGKPAAGSLEAKIKPGSWVVLKPNYCYLPGTQPGYRTGRRLRTFAWCAPCWSTSREIPRAKRITIAEGGSYRTLKDPASGNVVMQNGERVDLTTFNWGPDDFPGVGGSYGALLREFSEKFPGKTFDYVDLAYDVVRDASGNFLALPVPKLNGVGSFSRKTEYFVTNTVTKCDFLISLPVLKVHENCGMTCCFKNYVGTGPRIAYGARNMTNSALHNDHSVDTRIDPFIGDLAAFHPPDYNVVDVIRGLQNTEHNNRQPDQMIRTNMIMAGENPVALDALAATLIGFKPADIDYLHMAAARGLGSYDLKNIEVVGDEPDRYYRKWDKPRSWYARSNREWRVTRDPSAEVRNWTRHTSFGDLLDLTAAAGGEAPAYAATATVKSDGARKGFLWLGLTGAGDGGAEWPPDHAGRGGRRGSGSGSSSSRSSFDLGTTRLSSGSSRRTGGPAGALLVGPENNGDSLEGATWTA